MSVNYPLYKANHEDTWRFVLGSPGNRPLVTIGVNPHAANRTESDRTVSLVEKMARREGYDGFIMVNIYPVRSRTVSELPELPAQNAILENAAVVEGVLADYRTPTIWAAWGNDIDIRTFLKESLGNLATCLSPLKPTWLHYGELTKSGHPRHPSRLSYAWKFNTFDIERYLNRN